MTDALLTSIDPKGVVTVTLNRPELHNAFDDQLIGALTACFRKVDADPDVRAVILHGAGKSFSAGADLNWMRRMAGYSEAENLADAARLATMLQVFDTLSKPTIVAVHGNCFGGGLGLVACADIAIASETAVFCLSEVRLGLIPAVISPYVVRAMGARGARRYALTAERFGAQEALRLGFVHSVVGDNMARSAVDSVAAALVAGAPEAQAITKTLITEVDNRPIDADVAAMTAKAIAEKRASAEAREGLGAFFEKRKPGWQA
jgi:methylglutaconyl-CoA hydratase